MAALVLADHDGARLNEATRRAVAAAGTVSSPVHILIAADRVADIAKDAAEIAGVEKVLTAEAAHYEHSLAEPVAALIVSLADRYDAIAAAATTAGKNILPRVAARLDVPQISDVVAVESPDVFRRPIYAGNAIQTVEARGFTKVLTVRGAAFPPAPLGGTAAIESVAPAADPGLSRFVSENLSHSVRPELTGARIVVSGGRGVGSKENFALIEHLADRLGAGVGASRAAVDAGYVPNEYQVGQTGKIVAPELYIAVGISGAIQHQAGMKDSKCVVAINKDENAPIFQIADFGLVADLFEAVPQLEQALEKAGKAGRATP